MIGGNVSTLSPSKSRPKWRRLHETLRSEILTGRYECGSALPSHSRLAEQYGVSVPTVREAITALVHEQFLVCHHGRGTYVAENITPTKAKVEITKAHRPEHEAQLRVIDTLTGISLGAREHNLQTNMCSVEIGDPAGDQGTCRSALAQADGVIALLDTPNEVIRHCLVRGIPVVRADAAFQKADVAHVMIDRRAGAQRVVEHLRRLGHRHLAFVGRRIPPLGGVETELARLVGFLDAIGQSDVGIGPGHFIQCEKQYHRFREGARRILTCPPRPTAIVCSTAQTASAVMSVLIEEGIRVPADISLASLFNVAEWDYPHVALTGLETPFGDVGKQAARIIREAINGKDIENTSLVLQCPLLEGDSTAEPPVPG